MKILELNFWLAPGGAERFMVDLSNELSKDNEVVVVTVKDDKVDSEHRTFYKFALNRDVKYVNLGCSDGFSIKTIWAIYSIIKKEKPDVVHIQAETLLKFSFLALFLLCNKISFFETIHNDLHNGYDCGAFKFFAKVLGRRKKIRYIALSKTNYEEMRSFYPCCMFEHIDNGRAPVLPTERFEMVKAEMENYRKSKETKIFLHVARFCKQKNQSLLIESFNTLVSRGQDVVLIVIGAHFDGKDGISLQEKACSKVHFLGTRTNVSDYMLNADVFVLSSIFEGLPITLIESSLAGVPIVSTPVCGAVDIVCDGKNGILSKDFSEKSYVQALEQSISDFDCLKKNCDDLKKHNPFTIESCAKKYMNYFCRK